jgi:surface polysaccharide O-acyltransferase-like enzyme
MPSRANERHIGIDSFRYILCFPVALLHSLPGMAGHTTTIWATITACVCRGAVPFFFIASGYFMRTPLSWRPEMLIRPIGRLLPVYIAWFCVYAGIQAVQARHIDGLTVHGLLTGGHAVIAQAPCFQGYHSALI